MSATRHFAENPPPAEAEAVSPALDPVATSHFPAISQPLIAHRRANDTVAWQHGTAITARQFLADAHHLAAALPAGQHVLNICTDRYRFAVGMAAALLTGKISLLPPALTAEMVRQMHAIAPDVFCLTERNEPLELAQFDCAAALSTAPRSSLSADAADPFHIPGIPATQKAAIVFTSGSTGQPVGHPKSWGRLVQSVKAEARRLKLADALPPNIVATVPPQHMFGLESTMLLALQSGGAFSASHPFFPADICEALAAVPQPRMLVTTPFHLNVLLRSGLEVPSVQLVLSATAPLAPQLAVAAEAELDAPVMEIYGSTETGQIASRRTAETIEWRLFPDVALHVANGQSWASGGHIEQAMPMGDELELLGDERFLLHGRTADLINIAGKRSSLGYLNHQLNAVPGVVDGAFFMPDDVPGEGLELARLMAFAVAPDLDVAAVLKVLRERIDAIFIPRPLILLDELPRNHTGKLPRETLAALARKHEGHRRAR